MIKKPGAKKVGEEPAEIAAAMVIMNEISKCCVIEDIHMKEAELEDILKEIYKGAHKNVKNNDSIGQNAV